jgi:hypothetical protein
MPFCPKCGYEYEHEVTVCPDCDVALVDTRPVTEESELLREYEDWVPLARLTSPQYAEMIEEALSEKDIPVVIQGGTGHFGVTGQMGTSSFRPIGGGYTIHVPAEFVEDADIEGEAILGDDWIKGRLVDID